MSLAEPNLATIRREIDSIDDSIHDLIMRRTSLIEQIRAAKVGGDFYRPAREAEIVRRLIARHKGPFPKFSLVRMWREMMAAITRLQGPFSIAAFVADQEPGYWDVARSHFGVTVDIVVHQTPRSVLSAVRERTATVGLLPMPEEGEADPWWSGLGSATDPMFIIAKLPFAPIGARGDPRALLVGLVRQEKSGDDHSFLLVETAEPVSRARLTDALHESKLHPVALTARQTPPQFLVEIGDFVSPDDPRVAALAKILGGSVTPVGGFASPLAAAVLGK